ncbi:MAG: imidazolonepropionase [Anaerolineae bacterium]|nr:imidazolonepropionase [Anaerolineae bacterium]
MLIHSAAQLLTLKGGPQRGHALGTLGIIENGAVVVRDEKIVAVGDTEDLRNSYPNEPTIDASGSVVMPGFVDPHTHLVWAGDRADEFDKKMAGKPYLEILAEGGGIISTVMATRTASLESLTAQTRQRTQRMFEYGTTTAEAKTGYGLQLDTELRLLQTLIDLDREGPLELAITFLGAHAIPPEYKDNPQGYTDEITKRMLPELKDWWGTNAPHMDLPFVDVFCEHNAFTHEQSRQILTQACSLGFPIKIHADEFKNLGGASLAAELGAASADHLVSTSEADIATLAKSETVAVSLPCTPFGLAEKDYTPAHKFIKANAYFALASDCNPGTSWNESMQFVIALACRMLKLTSAQAIAASTINSAYAIRREDHIGSIEEGKQADILVMDIPDYRQIGYRYGTNLVKQVMKRGKLL